MSEACCQAIGLARSKDLHTWRRQGDGPVITPGPWGIWHKDRASDCRDPMVLKVGDLFYCYFTAVRHLDTKPGHELCVGIASSADLLQWKDEGFIRLGASLRTPPESPFMVQRGEKFYLFYSNYATGTALAVSDDPVQGWKGVAPEHATVISGVSASEVYRDGDTWYISMISHAPNALHFFEIRRLIWHDDGRVTTESLKPQLHD